MDGWGGGERWMIWNLLPARLGGCLRQPRHPPKTPTLPPHTNHTHPHRLRTTANDAGAASGGEAAGGSAAGSTAEATGNNRRVYVGNLSWSTAWQGLKDHMKQAGEGTWTSCVCDGWVGGWKCIAQRSLTLTSAPLLNKNSDARGRAAGRTGPLQGLRPRGVQDGGAGAQRHPHAQQHGPRRPPDLHPRGACHGVGFGWMDPPPSSADDPMTDHRTHSQINRTVRPVTTMATRPPAPRARASSTRPSRQASKQACMQSVDVYLDR